jgi:hypothetical protein
MCRNDGSLPVLSANIILSANCHLFNQSRPGVLRCREDTVLTAHELSYYGQICSSIHALRMFDSFKCFALTRVLLKFTSAKYISFSFQDFNIALVTELKYLTYIDLKKLEELKSNIIEKTDHHLRSYKQQLSCFGSF